MPSMFSFLARICLSAIFIFTSLQELISWNAQERFYYDLISSIWSSGVWGKAVADFLSYVINNFVWFFSLAIFFKLLGGICILFSWKPKFGSALLLVFLIPVTIIMHDFWNKTGAAQSQEVVNFLKNIAIVGGLFGLLAQGRSSDSKKQAPAPAKDKN